MAHDPVHDGEGIRSLEEVHDCAVSFNTVRQLFKVQSCCCWESSVGCRLPGLLPGWRSLPETQQLMRSPLLHIRHILGVIWKRCCCPTMSLDLLTVSCPYRTLCEQSVVESDRLSSQDGRFSARHHAGIQWLGSSTVDAGQAQEEFHYFSMIGQKTVIWGQLCVGCILFSTRCQHNDARKLSDCCSSNRWKHSAV